MTPFPTKVQWEHHVNLEHGLSQSSATTAECPICQDDTSSWLTNAIVHLAWHLEEIALTVLTTNPDSEDGTDLNSELASSESSTSDSLVPAENRHYNAHLDVFGPPPALKDGLSGTTSSAPQRQLVVDTFGLSLLADVSECPERFRGPPEIPRGEQTTQEVGEAKTSPKATDN